MTTPMQRACHRTTPRDDTRVRGLMSCKAWRPKEQRTHKPLVGSSNLPPATIKKARKHGLFFVFWANFS